MPMLIMMRVVGFDIVVGFGGVMSMCMFVFSGL